MKVLFHKPSELIVSFPRMKTPVEIVLRSDGTFFPDTKLTYHRRKKIREYLDVNPHGEEHLIVAWNNDLDIIKQKLKQKEIEMQSKVITVDFTPGNSRKEEALAKPSYAHMYKAQKNHEQMIEQRKIDNDRILRASRIK